MKKFKLLPTLFMLVLCVGVLAVGVFAITPTKNTISGTITVNASNPEVKISAYKYNADGTMKDTPFIAEQTVRSGINLNLGTDLAFDLSGVNTDTELAAKTIKIAIKIVNPGSNSLGAYFSEKEMTGALQNETDKITNKTLTTEKEVGASVNTVLTDYTEVTGSNGEAFMILEFNLTNFPNDNTTVNLTKTGNQMYLNIEEFQDDFVPAVVLPPEVKLTVVSNTAQPVNVELLKDGSALTPKSTSDSLTGIANEQVSILLNDMSFIEAGTTLDHIPDISVTLKVTNQGTAGIGAFFLKDALAQGAKADVENIRLEDNILKNTGEQVATASFTPYMYIAKNGYTVSSTSGFDTVEMTIVLRATDLNNLLVNNLNYTLVIEDYVANITTVSTYETQPTEGNESFDSAFLKLPDNLNSLGYYDFYNNDNIEHVVIPSSIIVYNVNGEYGWDRFTFSECDKLVAIGVNSKAQLGYDSSGSNSLFWYIPNLKHLSINVAQLSTADIISNSLEYLQYNSNINPSRGGSYGYIITKNIKSLHFGSLVTKLYGEPDYAEHAYAGPAEAGMVVEQITFSANINNIDNYFINLTSLKTIYVKAGSTATATLPGSGWKVKTATINDESVTSITDRNEDAVYWRP